MQALSSRRPEAETYRDLHMGLKNLNRVLGYSFV